MPTNLKHTLIAHGILFVILVAICWYADVPLYGAVLLSLVAMIINGVQRIFPFWD